MSNSTADQTDAGKRERTREIALPYALSPGEPTTETIKRAGAYFAFLMETPDGDESQA